MVNSFQTQLMVGLALLLAVPTMGTAQDISLGAGGSDTTWVGTQPNAAAGLWLDQGGVSAGDTRRDLIVGSPGGPAVPGAVYVIFGGGPDRTGDFVLSSADTVITSSEPGNRFGFATAAANIRNLEPSIPRNLVVGAPGANGGRGAVYLFHAGFHSAGPQQSEANAVFVVHGAPGDQLGTALATADLDNDGYREIIIGAPGNNRVYIIRGEAGLSGTVDLATSPAHRTIGAPGIGTVLAAGDVTGDGIYDLLIGAPSQNVVYLFVGATGTVPSTAAGSFSGVNPGDQAGASIRILDINGDDKPDLAIGAPGAGGPDGGRAQAGSVYLFIGPVGTGAMSLASSHAVFFGPTAGWRAGESLAAGDINRDKPNDLVVHGPGGASGAGELAIYYGRSANSIGSLQPNGRRFVDFAVPGQVSRRILGDPGAGPITAVQVYEVTGEGARDVIVGVAGADSGTGKLYFTISPKLRLSTRSLTLAVNRGGTAISPSPVEVRNASTVFINWQTSSNRPWLSTSPTSGSADHNHTASLFVIAESGALASGTHTGRVTVASNSPDLEMAIPIDVTLHVTDVEVALDAPVHGTQVSPAFNVAGWAIDRSATSGTGVDQIHVYAYPNPGSGQTGISLGTATYGHARGDVGNIYGAQFTNSGFSMHVSSLTPGTTYQIAVFARSTVTNRFMLSRTAVVTLVQPGETPDPTPQPMPNPNPGPEPTPNPNPSPGPGPGPTPPPGPTPDTRLVLNRAAMYFGVRSGGNGVKSGPQTLGVSFTGGSAAWTASSSVDWLELTPASGVGAGTITITIKSGSYPMGPARPGAITITASGVANSPISVPVTLTILNSGASPIGVVDTPVNHTTGVTGAIAVTGWALDDIGIKEVSIWRDPVAGEFSSAPNGKIFVGRAVPVDGARPDVAATYAQPFNYQAGWGYMLLTNMLPNQGNGTFALHAYAEDHEGRTTLLGSRTMTCDNAGAVKPFGAIDTPDQGGTASGTSYTNFGWTLAQNPHQIPTDGSTLMVFIDGVPVGRPTYNQFRGDIAALFPGRANSNGAIGYFQFDTTRLSNGVHTIAWAVGDNAGNVEGIGSRYFTVMNSTSASALTLEATSSFLSMSGGGADLRESANSGSATWQPASSLEADPLSSVPVYRRDGFDPSAALHLVEADSTGVLHVSTQEAGRFALTLGSPVSGSGGYEGYVVANGRLEPLPAGAFLDRHSGDFFWQPGVGFSGTYDLVFIRTTNDARERIRVAVQIN
ncbi:hypothetical protein BH23ACI1_BH23ACI1_26770 [soil metagenome]